MNIHSINMGKFMIIEQLQNINTKIEIERKRIFWTRKLKTLTPYSLNQGLN